MQQIVFQIYGFKFIYANKTCLINSVQLLSYQLQLPQN